MLPVRHKIRSLVYYCCTNTLSNIYKQPSYASAVLLSWAYIFSSYLYIFICRIHIAYGQIRTVVPMIWSSPIRWHRHKPYMLRGNIRYYVSRDMANIQYYYVLGMYRRFVRLSLTAHSIVEYYSALAFPKHNWSRSCRYRCFQFHCLYLQTV